MSVCLSVCLSLSLCLLLSVSLCLCLSVCLCLFLSLSLSLSPCLSLSLSVSLSLSLSISLSPCLCLCLFDDCDFSSEQLTTIRMVIRTTKLDQTNVYCPRCPLLTNVHLNMQRMEHSEAGSTLPATRQQRRNQRHDCPVDPLGFYGGCSCITPTVGAMQKQPKADPMGRRHSTTGHHDVTVRRSPVRLHPESDTCPACVP